MNATTDERSRLWRTSQDAGQMLDWLLHWEGNGGGAFNCHPRLTDRKLRLFAAAMWRGHPDILARFGASALPELAERQADGLATTEEVSLARETIGLDVDGCGLPYGAYVRQAARHLACVLMSGPRCVPEKRRQALLLRDIVGDPWRQVHHRTPCNICRWAGKWYFSDPCVVCEGRGWMMSPGLDPAWLTLEVVSLARAAYDEPRERCPCHYAGEYGSDCQRCHGTGNVGTLDPVRLSVLADCLEERGCTSGELLGHLRGDMCPTCKGEAVICNVMGGGHATTVPASRAETWPSREEPRTCPWCRGGRVPGVHVRGCWALDLILGKE